MKVITLKAHFDGKVICLDDPYPLSPNTRLLVTVVPGDSEDAERQAWLTASQTSMGRAYSNDEPDYTDAVPAGKTTGKMKEGDIILVPVPQSDGQTKRRPAVLLRTMPPYGDFLVCGMSTQLRHQELLRNLANHLTNRKAQ